MYCIDYVVFVLLILGGVADLCRDNIRPHTHSHRNTLCALSTVGQLITYSPILIVLVTSCDN
jgi:hypothetical protein